MLGWFKYGDFLLSIVEGRRPHAPEVPLALSFTTFVQIAFLVDVWRRRDSVNFPAYAMFVAFFPHLIAGPIVRWDELGPQLRDRARYRPDWNNIALGLTIFCLGLAKKVLIADSLSPHVGPVFDAAARGEALTAAAAWGAAYAYTAQLYFDFSGYSDMAVGLGLLFNLRLPINFAAPLRATSIIDLWRRWHISLSRFLRDFVYVPLGGAAGGPARRTTNLFAHHGDRRPVARRELDIRAVGRVSRRAARDQSCAGGSGADGAPRRRLGRFAGWAATFTAFVIGMVLFRAADLPAASNMFQAMAGFGGAPRAEAMNVSWDSWGMRVGLISEDFVRIWMGANWSVVGTLWTAAALAIILFVPDTMELTNYREGEPHSDWRRNVGALMWRPSPVWIAGLVVLFGAAYANLLRITEFLYYQF